MKIHRVERASRPQGNCSRCGTIIASGDPYKWIKSRFGPKVVFCKDHEPRPSDMTTSDKLSRLYSAVEELEDVDTRDKELVFDTLESACTTAEEVAQDYEDSLNSMPQNFQDGERGQEIQEKIEACNSWEGELRLLIDELGELEEWNPEKVRSMLNDTRLEL